MCSNPQSVLPESLYRDKAAKGRGEKKKGYIKIGVTADIPTVLSLMGYKETDLEKGSGLPGLFAAPPAFVCQVVKWKSRFGGGAERPFTPIRL
ncbi:hypothetical protein TNCT_327801 [Trichonephila clavata]|uniref:Uncharacterized protein n=1 Tax=Trichonephila clavata TaxID=2740835 RepID=A0A8X6FZ61_TRICU|nr:hypothetical protein TNCT_327801 [Trichonephila clavata]